MAESAASSADLVLRPDPKSWLAALSRPRADTTLRQELGLPVDRPIFMSGHQPTVWHPGILAKWIAMVRFAQAHGAHAAWVVVDHDAVAPTALRLPVVRADGSLGVHAADLSASEYLPGAPACSHLATPTRVPVLPQGDRLALTSVSEGLIRINAACVRFVSTSSAAEQATRAVSKLIHEGVLIDAPEPTLIFASHLARTSAFRAIVALMLKDPARCVRDYNSAVEAHPSVRLRPLSISKDDAELPLWQIKGSQRFDVRASSLQQLLASGDAAWNSLAPKALFMTLLLRLHACDLFMHGLGGGGLDDDHGYDEVMQDWARRWLGIDAASTQSLALMATVSATLRLPFEGDPPITPSAAARSRWTAWHARNEPALVGDQQRSREKRALADTIMALPKHDPRRRAAFVQLRSLVSTFQKDRSADLAQLAADAHALQEQAARDSIRLDRTWAFPFYTPQSLAALRRSIEDQLLRAKGAR